METTSGHFDFNIETGEIEAYAPILSTSDCNDIETCNTTRICKPLTVNDITFIIHIKDMHCLLDKIRNALCDKMGKKKRTELINEMDNLFRDMQGTDNRVQSMLNDKFKNEFHKLYRKT